MLGGDWPFLSLKTLEPFLLPFLFAILFYVPGNINWPKYHISKFKISNFKLHIKICFRWVNYASVSVHCNHHDRRDVQQKAKATTIMYLVGQREWPAGSLTIFFIFNYLLVWEFVTVLLLEIWRAGLCTVFEVEEKRKVLKVLEYMSSQPWLYSLCFKHTEHVWRIWVSETCEQVEARYYHIVISTGGIVVPLEISSWITFYLQHDFESSRTSNSATSNGGRKRFGV